MTITVSSNKISCNQTWLMCSIPNKLVKNSILENTEAHQLTKERLNIRYLQFKHFDQLENKVFFTENYLISNFSAN